MAAWAQSASCEQGHVGEQRHRGYEAFARPTGSEVLVGLDECCDDVRDSLANQLPGREPTVGADCESRTVIEGDCQDILVNLSVADGRMEQAAERRQRVVALRVDVVDLSGSVQLERCVDDDLAADHCAAGRTLSEKQGHLVIEEESPDFGSHQG